MKDIAENQTEQIKETAVSAEPDRETVTDSFPENISENREQEYENKDQAYDKPKPEVTDITAETVWQAKKKCPRPSQTLCKPPMRCRIEASHRR